MADTPHTQLVPVELPGLGQTYLDQSMVPRVHAFIDYAHRHGVELHFNSAYRSPEHQASLHNDPHAITPATHSLHSAGFAVDVNYISLPADQQRVVREAAQASGLEWGGGFTRKDPPHFYRDPPVDRDTAIAQATRDYEGYESRHAHARATTVASAPLHDAGHPTPSQVHHPLPAHPQATDPRHHQTQVHEHALVLREGAQGRAVHDLQTSLAAMGYRGDDSRSLHADSDFGPRTKHAVEAFQRAHGLEPDGIAGPRTLAALSAAQPAHDAVRIDNPAHADHVLFRQAQAHVHALDAKVQRTSNEQSDNFAAALVVEAKSEHLRGIHGLGRSEDGSRAFAVDSTQANDPYRRYAGVDVVTAMNQPIAESSRRLAEQSAAQVSPPAMQPQQDVTAQSAPRVV